MLPDFSGHCPGSCVADCQAAAASHLRQSITPGPLERAAVIGGSFRLLGSPATACYGRSLTIRGTGH